MKKSTAIIVAALTAFSLAGCKQPDDTNQSVGTGRFVVAYQGRFYDNGTERRIFILTDTTTKTEYVMVNGYGAAQVAGRKGQ